MNRRVILPIVLGILVGIGRADEPRRAVVDAAERGDLEAVRKLLADGADAREAQADGTTALHWAAHRGDRAVARVLLHAGADAKATNLYGVAPLSVACESGDAEIVEALLEAGADADTLLPGGETALMTAARTGLSAPVRALLSRGAKVDATERSGQTALMWAAAEGHDEVVRELLAAGAALDVRLASGFTAFFFAVREGKSDVVRTLLEAGVDVDDVMDVERSPHKGARKGTAALMLATESGHFDLAVALLEAGADPNDQRSGYTPLHAITWVRKPNRGDGPDGDPPPVGSGDRSSLQFVRALVEHGADADARLERGASGRGKLGRRGATPFLLACVTADVPLMKLLLELGADPSIPNADGATPVMAAAGLGTFAPTEEAGTEAEVLEALELLVSLGADLDVIDANGETAMHGAAYKNLPLVVRFLAEKGASVDQWYRENRWGWTPLTIAAGYRVGNFKPSPETLGALETFVRAAGVEPPADYRPKGWGEWSDDD